FTPFLGHHRSLAGGPVFGVHYTTLPHGSDTASRWHQLSPRRSKGLPLAPGLPLVGYGSSLGGNLPDRTRLPRQAPKPSPGGRNLEALSTVRTAERFAARKTVSIPPPSSAACSQRLTPGRTSAAG